MWILAWSMNFGRNEIEDYWIICEDEKAARRECDKLLADPRLHCWAIAPITRASDPHWEGASA